jgi:hypothetical protein
MIPTDTTLGTLEIFEIYEYIDAPRLFAVRNNIGTMYLVYWCDEKPESTGWLYLPISDSRLSDLRRKKITLYNAFNKPETNYYLVYINHITGIDIAQAISPDIIDTELFPPEGFYLEHVDVINNKTDGWNFETVLNGRKPSAEVLSQFVGRFRELVEDIMNSISCKSYRLYPQSASPGSIKIKFSSDNNDYAIESLHIINELIKCEKAQLINKLEKYRINSYQLKDFLNVITRHGLDVEIAPKLASDGDAMRLSIDAIKQCIEWLDEVTYVTIESIDVPQANDINKMLEIVKLIDDGLPLTPDNIDGITVDRQVQYYTDAAYAFGLTTKDKKLTPAGRLVISHTEKTEQYQILAERFESTNFGWAWITWAQVQYMTELDPESAVDFLFASVPKLSEETASRRASTLKKWLLILQPYHRKYVTK